MAVKGLLYLLFLVSIPSIYADVVSVAWEVETGKYSIHDGEIDNWVAYADFRNKINETGWSYLEVYTNGSYKDAVQAYAAGLAEGFVSKDLIALNWENNIEGYCDKKNLTAYCKRLVDYLESNFVWVGYQIEDKEITDPYWHQVALFLTQVNGMQDGYLGTPSYARYSVDVLGLMFLQITGDLEDLESALKKDNPKKVFGSGSCSALIKLLPGNEDLYVSQDTWSGFSTMIRVLKKYDFQFHVSSNPNSPIIPGQVMTFSSYPGYLYSGDDFSIISSGLVTLETTIGNSNASLWSEIKTENSVLEGIRCTVANRMAQYGDDWCEIFSKFNSGTYNNEWMVVDYKQFTPNKPLQDATLFVLEQIPGTIVYHDKTELLRKQTYWPSYNTPYYTEIFDMSGGKENVAKYGDWFSYDKTPRAQIFKRDHIKVKDLESMTRLMRYNDFPRDPLSACNCTPPYSGENAISARSDLNPANGKYAFSALGHRAHGGTDMKLTSYSMAKDLEFIAVFGPTYDDVPPFQWSTADFRDTVKHKGQPNLFMFKPEQHEWGVRP